MLKYSFGECAVLISYEFTFTKESSRFALNTIQESHWNYILEATGIFDRIPRQTITIEIAHGLGSFGLTRDGTAFMYQGGNLASPVPVGRAALIQRNTGYTLQVFFTKEFVYADILPNLRDRAASTLVISELLRYGTEKSVPEAQTEADQILNRLDEQYGKSSIIEIMPREL